MATGDSKLSICSDSLILLGSSPLSSFSEGTDSAQICDRLYDDTKDMLLGMYPWSFSYKKVQLAQTVNSPATEWTYEYSLPSDMIGSGVRAVFTSSVSGASSINTGWEILGDKLVTNETSIYVDYQCSPSEDVLPTYFIQLLKYFMAWHIAESVTDQITKAQYFQTIAVGSVSENKRGGMFRQATQIDGQNRPKRSMDDIDLTAIR